MVTMKAIIKRMILIMTIWNITVICFLHIMLGENKRSLKKTIQFSQSLSTEKDLSDSVSKIKAVTKTKKSKITNLDQSMVSVYSSLIIGNYSLKNGLKYSFSSDGKFSGYFDDKHTSVKNYHYEVVSTGGNNVLNIYNEEKTSVVTYYVMLSDDADIVLYYPESDVKFLLE